MQGSGFTRREIVWWDLNIQCGGYYKQTWIYVDTTKRGILCKYNHLDVFYYYRIIYVHVKMLDIYGYRPFPFRICISGGSSAVAVGEGEGAGGGHHRTGPPPIRAARKYGLNGTAPAYCL